jgi:uncharacterized oligopeptide transporter (OPT) family protein
MSDSPEPKNDKTEGAKPKKGWLFFSKSVADKSSNFWLTVLAIAMVVVIFTIMILATYGLLPNLGGGSTSSLSSSSINS